MTRKTSTEICLHFRQKARGEEKAKEQEEGGQPRE
jgi:hypothetical protein